MMQSSDNNKSISVNIAVLTVSDTRTINNDKSGDYLVKSVKQEGHKYLVEKLYNFLSDENYLVIFLKL